MIGYIRQHKIRATLWTLAALVFVVFTIPGNHMSGVVLAGIWGVIALYWLPSIMAHKRHVPNAGSVVVLNALLAWTIVGWIIALAMALRDPAPVAAQS